MKNGPSVSIYWSEEDGIYIASVDSLVGVMTHGSSIVEAAKNAEEAIALHLASLEAELAVDSWEILEIFRQHEADGFRWFCDNPNLSDIADELKQLMSALDTANAEIARLKFELSEFDKIALIQKRMFGPSGIRHMGDVLLSNDQLKEKLRVARQALFVLSIPCTRTDYTLGVLDKIVTDIASEALAQIDGDKGDV